MHKLLGYNLVSYCFFLGKVPDERALYLRSLDNKNTPHRADTATLGGKFKLAYGVGHDIDVFSQVIPLVLVVVNSAAKKCDL